MSQELKQFDELKGELTQLVSPALQILVVDFASSHQALEAAKTIKVLQKRVETKRKELVEPLNAKVRAINEYAKDIAWPLQNAEAYLKGQLSAFEIEQEKIRQEAFRKAEEERLKKEAELAAAQEAERDDFEAAVVEQADAADLFGSDGPDMAAANEQAKQLEARQAEEQAALTQAAKTKEWEIKQQGVKNARKVWKCEAIDLSQVPKEFLVITLNQAAVLAAARGGVTSIPGVKLWQETTIAIGANSYVPAFARNR